MRATAGNIPLFVRDMLMLAFLPCTEKYPKLLHEPCCKLRHSLDVPSASRHSTGACHACEAGGLHSPYTSCAAKESLSFGLQWYCSAPAVRICAT